MLSIGGPGSGKGTQCDKIIEDYKFAHFSVGDLLRDEVKNGSPIGQQVDTLMKEGKIVPTVSILLLLYYFFYYYLCINYVYLFIIISISYFYRKLHLSY